MPITAHVYQIYIAATPDQVWSAITDSAWTRRYFHGTSFVEPPTAGSPYRTVTSDGRPAIDGVIEEMQPPSDEHPGRFVQTWHVMYDTAMSDEPPSRVEWTIEPAGNGLTRVRLVHGDLGRSPLTWANVKDGWIWVLDSLKSLLETDRALPSVTRDTEAAEIGDPDWHRAQAVEANDSIWDLVSKPNRSEDDQEEMLRRAYAAAYHWQRARNAKPENAARAEYMIAKVLLLTGQPARSLRSAERCLAICLEQGLGDFDLAYAQEARARALRALGRDADAAEAWATATSIPVADPQDREILEADFADY